MLGCLALLDRVTSRVQGSAYRVRQLPARCRACFQGWQADAEPMWPSFGCLITSIAQLILPACSLVLSPVVLKITLSFSMPTTTKHQTPAAMQKCAHQPCQVLDHQPMAVNVDLASSASATDIYRQSLQLLAAVCGMGLCCP